MTLGKSSNHRAESHPDVISNGPITCRPVEERASKEANCLMLLTKLKEEMSLQSSTQTA